MCFYGECSLLKEQVCFYGECSLLKEEVLPFNNELPPTRQDAKNILTSIGLDYNEIDACPKDCILFRGLYEHLTECPNYGSNRYHDDLQGATVPVKVLKHFPIIPSHQKHVQM